MNHYTEIFFLNALFIKMLFPTWMTIKSREYPSTLHWIVVTFNRSLQVSVHLFACQRAHKSYRVYLQARTFHYIKRNTWNICEEDAQAQNQGFRKGGLIMITRGRTKICSFSGEPPICFNKGNWFLCPLVSRCSSLQCVWDEWDKSNGGYIDFWVTCTAEAGRSRKVVW